MKIKIFLFVFTLTFLFACEDPNTVWVTLEVADCCNPWEEEIDKTPLQSAGVFLIENNIQILDSEFVENERRAICVQCCHCPTNSFVRFEILGGQLEMAESFGFLEE